MKKILPITIVILLVTVINFVSCTWNKEPEPLVKDDTNYPVDVKSIVIAKCAVTGCHNTQSKDAAGGLNLSTWDKLLEGSRGGAVVIPYRPDFSTFCYYTNTDTTKGLVLQPTMPYNAAPLSEAEYITLKTWIETGAPDKNGFVKFSDYQTKSKLYITNRGCDVVTILDPVTGLAMRYIDIGIGPEIEAPCMVKVSPDKLYWYVIFNQGTTIQKFRTSDNTKAGEINIGQGFWSSLVITGDSKKAFIADADVNGRILYADLENMQVVTNYQTGLRYPFGLCLNNANNRLYAAPQEGNFIYKIDISNPLMPLITEISLETSITPNYSPSINPYEIVLSVDESYYFVTCNKSAELRVMRTSNDSLLNTYSTGSNPTGMIASSKYLFISCLGVPGTNKKSVINIFDLSSGNFLPEINAGHDSKGIVFDATTNKLFVTNRNVSNGGPAAHHAPACAGKNGYLTAIDLNTLQLVPDFKVELSVDPYHIVK